MKLNSRSNESHFIDKDFPPTIDSFYPKTVELSAEESKKWDEYEWIHCTDLDEKTDLTVNSIIDSFKLTQNKIENCYFVGVLISLGTDPERIKRLFSEDTKDSEREKFEVNVYPMGIRTTMVVDGYFPYLQSCQSLAFSRSIDFSLWSPILEKIWAKYLGSYYNIINKNPSIGFSFLSGYPCEVVKISEVKMEDFWKKLLEVCEKKFPMICSTINYENQPEKAEELEKLGLKGKYPYSIIRAEVSSVCKLYADGRK